MIDKFSDFKPEQQIDYIVNKIHKAIPFFQKYFYEFCEKVEDYAGILAQEQIKQREQSYKVHEEIENCDKNIEKAQLLKDIKKEKQLKNDRKKLYDKYDQVQKESKNLREKLKEKWIHYSIVDKYPEEVRYLKLPYFDKLEAGYGSFYSPAMKSPLSWACDDFNSSENISEDEIKLHDFVILSIIHDNKVGKDEKNIYSKADYKGKYFNCGRFCNKTWPIDRIQRAYDNIEDDLNEWLEGNITHGNGGEEEISKFGKIIECLKGVAEKGWQIFTKSFWESFFERIWPKG